MPREARNTPHAIQPRQTTSCRITGALAPEKLKRLQAAERTDRELLLGVGLVVDDANAERELELGGLVATLLEFHSKLLALATALGL